MLSCQTSARTYLRDCLSMVTFFSIALGLGSLEIGLIVFAGFGFLVMFGISSAKGGYNDLIKTTLENDQLRRKNNRN